MVLLVIGHDVGHAVVTLWVTLWSLLPTTQPPGPLPSSLLLEWGGGGCLFGGFCAGRRNLFIVHTHDLGGQGGHSSPLEEAAFIGDTVAI